MKLRDIMKAQARYDEISEQIKGLGKCKDQFADRIEALKKEREEISRVL